MGDEFVAHGTRAIIIADVQVEKGHHHRHDVIVIALQSRQSLSLSFGGWLFLIAVGWLILVDGGRLIGLWV